MASSSPEHAVASAVAVLICALGRACDFATTWVALGKGSAVEAKPVASGFFLLFGHQTGLIVYEGLITTPAIFLGLYLAQRLFRDSPVGAANARRLLLFLVGVISLAIATHNLRFLL